jgi:hypothetical protein
MAGALMQLVAYGAQNVYLNSKPEITFFKAVYKRHTNFACESMRQVLNGRSTFGNKVTCKVSRNGDLMGPCYVQATLPALTQTDATGYDYYCNSVGFRLLREVQLRIGGQLIDKQSATWMHCWSELTSPVEKQANDSLNLTSTLSRLVGLKELNGVVNNLTWSTNAQVVNVPLQFFFCRHPGLYLPLIALQYHEVEISVELETQLNCLSTPSNELAASVAGSLSNVALWVDYIFLDTEERKAFAQNPHEYLIETVQEQQAAVSAATNNVRLTFNHPVKELVWVVRETDGSGDKFTNFMDGATLTLDASGKVTASAAGTVHPVTLATLKLNGQKRFEDRPGLYFSGVQPYQHHSGNPDNGICSYSFALRPEEHQPSGTCNFSRIDNAELSVTSTMAGTLTVMAHGYNVLRVASGMGGLAYSN